MNPVITIFFFFLSHEILPVKLIWSHKIDTIYRQIWILRHNKNKKVIWQRKKKDERDSKL